MVERGDSVGCDKQQFIAQRVDVADLAPRDERQTAEISGEEGFCHMKTVPLSLLSLRPHSPGSAIQLSLGGVQVGGKRGNQPADGGFSGFKMGRQTEIA